MTTVKTLADKELQQHYDDMFLMFASPGWASLMETVEQLIEGAESIRNAGTLESLYYKKGELANLEWLKGMRASHEFNYSQLLEEDTDPSEAMTGGVAKVVS